MTPTRTPGDQFMHHIAEDYEALKTRLINNAKRLGGSFNGLGVADPLALWEDLYVECMFSCRKSLDNKGTSLTRQESIAYMYRSLYNGHKKLCGWLKKGVQLQSTSDLAALIQPHIQTGAQAVVETYDGQWDNPEEDVDAENFAKQADLLPEAMQWLAARMGERACALLRMRDVGGESWPSIAPALGYSSRHHASASYKAAQRCLRCWFEYPELRGAAVQPSQPIAWAWHAGSREHAQLAIMRYEEGLADKEIKELLGLDRLSLVKVASELDGLCYAMYGKAANEVF